MRGHSAVSSQSIRGSNPVLRGVTWSAPLTPSSADGRLPPPGPRYLHATGRYVVRSVPVYCLTHRIGTALPSSSARPFGTPGLRCTRSPCGTTLYGRRISPSCPGDVLAMSVVSLQPDLRVSRENEPLKVNVAKNMTKICC